MRIAIRLVPAVAVLAMAAGGGIAEAAIAAQERKAVLERFATRFAHEVFPVLNRASNGCVACHHAESSQAFRVLRSPAATFARILEHDLLAPGDPMAIPGRIATDAPEFRMPQAGELSAQERDLVQQFSADLATALSGASGDEATAQDERFPDALLLPYDGPESDLAIERRMSFYQLRRSLETIFGKRWLAGSGYDPLANKANLFGGADFRASFDSSRRVSASYLSALQEVAREVARRYVSAPASVLFEGFDPDISAARQRKRAARNVKALYEHILFATPSDLETERALDLVRALQGQPVGERIVRFTLHAEDDTGREDGQEADVLVREGHAKVSRFWIDQAAVTADEPWLRVGDAPFAFQAGNSSHFVRVVARPGNHVTAFDAVKLVRVADGTETDEAIVLDNLDPECTLAGDWEPVEKEGERSRAGPPKKKYEQAFHVVGSNHLESRTLDNRLSQATMAVRIPASGDYNVYLSWPAIPRAAPSTLVEVHAASGAQLAALPPVAASEPLGFARVRIDQTESTLDATGETQWEMVQREVRLDDESDYVEISNAGLDSTKHVIVADAVKFVPLGGGDELVVDNGSAFGFEQSEGWAPDELTRNSPGRGKMFGKDVLHYPPAKNGTPIKDHAVDPTRRVWARYRPVRDGTYQPGWYSVHVWTPGGHTHPDWVAVDTHASEYAPVAAVEAVPDAVSGQSVVLNGSGTLHPGGKPLTYRWTHDAHDLGFDLEGADTATPRFQVPSLASPRPGWAGLIEALLQHPEFIVRTDAAGAPPSAVLARVALDLMGRLPTQQEVRRFRASGSLESMVDSFLASADFKDFFFHRARIALRSRGTEESDEPARLWTYLATNDLTYRELFTADYTVDADWNRVSRRSEHGPTGILTMKGYLAGKPGLPKFTYPAQVLTFALGLQFEVSDAVEEAREKVVSTTDPASMCYSCHKLLTPLAYQRERWDIHGHYRTVDDDHSPIDDSDRGVVADYPFKGAGLSAFSTQVVRKEKFVRAFVNVHHDMLFHRKLRIHEDQRDEYRELYEFAVANELKIRPLLKRMVLLRYGRS